MKKMISFSLLLALSLVLLTSCGSAFQEGEYVCEIAGINFMTIEFEGEDVLKTSRSGEVTNGIYEVENNIIRVSWEDGSKDEFVYDEETKSFKIDGVDYMVWTKQIDSKNFSRNYTT